MGDRYNGMIKCPYCGEDTEYLFNDEWGTEQWCDKCEKEFTMKLTLSAHKVDSPKSRKVKHGN